MPTATNALIRKSFTGITKVVDEAQGLIEAIVNSTGIVDLQNDVMEPGCWDGLCKSMSAGEIGYPTILSNHNWEIPVGKVVHAEELLPGDVRLKALKSPQEAGGLRIIGQYNLETQRGREAFSDARKEIVPQWSVGFMPAEDGHTYDKSGIHRISKVGMWPEVSNVLVGASPGTRTTATKSAEAVLTNPSISISDKAAAVEQACLQAVEDGDSAEALTIALEALHALTAAHDALVSEAVKTAYEAGAETAVRAFLDEARALPPADELSVAPPPLQHSDPELDTSGDEERLPYWARYNVALIRPDNL